MSLYWIVALTISTHIAYKGSKVLMALTAIEYGADPVTVGFIFSLYSLFPLFLAVHVGRLGDRKGPRVPMLIGAIGLSLGLVLPAIFPVLPALFASAAIFGGCYIFYIVSAQHLVGAMGTEKTRAQNYSIYSVGVSVTGLVGPIISGFSIDTMGHRATFLVLAAFPAVATCIIAYIGRRLPKAAPKASSGPGQRAMDLVKDRPLRRILITAGIIETGGELYNFYLPIYGHSIGLSASTIGMILGTFAFAMLIARGAMAKLVKMSNEETVLYLSLALSAATCCLFPFVQTVPPLVLISFSLGLGLGCCTPLSMLITYNRAPAGRSGEAIGMRQMMTKFTEVMVPVVFGALGTAFGIGLAFWIDALMLGSAALLMRSDAAERPAVKRAPA